MTETAVKHKLHRLTLAVIIVVLTLCVASGGVLHYLYQSMQASIQMQLQAETQEYKKRILKQIDYNFQCLRTAASILSYDDLEDRERLHTVLQAANGSNDFVNMAFFTRDRMGVMTRSDVDNPQSFPLAQCQQDVIDTVEAAFEGKESISRPFSSADFRTAANDEKLCTYSVPVYKGGEVMGVLSACDNIGIFEEILSGDTVLGGQGYLHLLNDQGEFLIRSSYSVIKEQPETLLDDSFMSEEAQEAARQAFANQSSASSSFVYDGNRYQFYITPVGVNNWYLYCADTDMSTSQYMGHILMVAAVSLSLVVLVAVAILYLGYMAFRRNSAALVKLAYYDPVTGAENAARFEQRLEERKAQHLPYGIVAVNIHRFKFINELHGSAGGDQVLRDLKAAIEEQLRPGEFFCRDAADLFYILMEDTDETVLRERVERLTAAVRTAWQKHYGGGVSLYCGVAVGGDRMQALLAMQSIQASMQTEISFYDAKVHAEERRKCQIENTMQLALDQEQFELFLQPKFRLDTGALAGAEALVRWRKSDGTYRYPNEFIPLFEENGFCIQLDLYMMEQVCRQLRRWMDAGRVPVPISVNQTRLLFFSAGYVEKLTAIVRKYDVPPRYVTLEILESVATGNTKELNDVIDQLHQQGFRVSMDDFGTGYSSLNALYQLKIDELKLDRGFMAMAATEEDAARRRAILDQIIQFARTMGLETVAEGVETAEDEALLQELHCDLGQGYYYSKPVDVKTFDETFMQ